MIISNHLKKNAKNGATGMIRIPVTAIFLTAQMLLWSGLPFRLHSAMNRPLLIMKWYR